MSIGIVGEYIGKIFVEVKQRPRFRITERIDYDRRRLTENRMWEDRVDELTPDIIEWRDSRTSNKK